MLPSYMGILINHRKDPYKPTRIWVVYNNLIFWNLMRSLEKLDLFCIFFDLPLARSGNIGVSRSGIPKTISAKCWVSPSLLGRRGSNTMASSLQQFGMLKDRLSLDSLPQEDLQRGLKQANHDLTSDMLRDFSSFCKS